jgi:hypothetical protein
MLRIEYIRCDLHELHTRTVRIRDSTVLADVRRVLTPAGRVGVVAAADRVRSKAISRVYEWVHQHWPRLVDCGPIDAEGAHSAAGFVPVQVASTDMWTLPVAVVVDEQTSRSAR